MLLGTSHARWWSSRRCVAIERIGSEIVVHDLGAAFGQDVWIRYPLLADGGRPMGGHSGLESMADSIADSVSNVLVAKKDDKKSCEFADRIRQLVGSSDEARLAAATYRLRSLDVEKVTSKETSEGRWLLSSSTPRLRLHVTAAPDDIAEVEARLSAVLGR